MITVFAVIYCEFHKFEFFQEKGTDPPPNPSSRSAHDIPTVYGPTLDTNGTYILDTKVKKNSGLLCKIRITFKLKCTFKSKS